MIILLWHISYLNSVNTVNVSHLGHGRFGLKVTWLVLVVMETLCIKSELS